MNWTVFRGILFLCIAASLMAFSTLRFFYIGWSWWFLLALPVAFGFLIAASDQLEEIYMRFVEAIDEWFD